MLEARVHQQLKQLLHQDGGPLWGHHLSLSRLVARSLRRHDVTLIAIAPGSEPSWHLSALLPCCLAGEAVALVVSQQLHQRLQRVDLPRLHRAGIATPLWEGDNCPQDIPLWLLKPAELLRAHQGRQLQGRQLVVLDSGQLERDLQSAMGVTLEVQDWHRLQQAHPALAQAVGCCFDQLNHQVFAHSANPWGRVPISEAAEAPLRQLLVNHGPLPDPWQRWLQARSAWASWAEVDYRLLRWRWWRQPLDPLRVLRPLLSARGVILCGSPGPGKTLEDSLGNRPVVRVKLGDPPLQDPLPLYAPRRQPLPNTPVFPHHLLDQCRRLVLARSGLTAVLLDDMPLRQALASGLAAEFGSRVVHQCLTPADNGVVVCRLGLVASASPRTPPARATGDRFPAPAEPGGSGHGSQGAVLAPSRAGLVPGPAVARCPGHRAAGGGLSAGAAGHAAGTAGRAHPLPKLGTAGAGPTATLGWPLPACAGGGPAPVANPAGCSTYAVGSKAGLQDKSRGPFGEWTGTAQQQEAGRHRFTMSLAVASTSPHHSERGVDRQLSRRRSSFSLRALLSSRCSALIASCRVSSLAMSSFSSSKRCPACSRETSPR